MRLNKYVQENLGISRRSFVEYVTRGFVFLDGKKVESIGIEVSGGEKIEIRNLKINKKVVIGDTFNIVLFNKPIGYVCSKSDKHNKTIYELLPKELQNYFYIGRLDKDSRGLLLLTNNAQLVDKYQHPRNQVEKEYIVQIDRMFSHGDFQKVKKGIEDEGDILTVNTMKYYSQKNKYFVNMILGEGKKRHIRRIMKSLGYKVLDLVRVREGQFELGNLREGCLKKISYS